MLRLWRCSLDNASLKSNISLLCVSAATNHSLGFLLAFDMIENRYVDSGLDSGSCTLNICFLDVRSHCIVKAVLAF